MNPKLFRNSKAGKIVKVQGDYWAFIPNPLPPHIDYPSTLIQALTEAERSLGELKGVSDALVDANLLIKPFIRVEAVLSSRIEGTRASLEDVLSYESTQLPLIESGSDVKEVHNYVNALEYGLERLKTLPISLRLIKEMHARLLQGVRGEIWTPGEFRTRQNWIGATGATLQEADYVPPPPPEMMDSLGRMEQFINQVSEIAEVIRIGMIHYQFEAIHPFADGNGRMGRLLIALMMQAWGILPKPVLNLSAYFEADRQSYYQHLLAVSQRGEWQAWLMYFLKGIKQESEQAKRCIKALDRLRIGYLSIVKKERAGERLSQVVNALFSSPIMTIRQLEKMLGFNYPAADRCMERLVNLGMLRELTGQARNRIYQADEIIRIMKK